MHLQIGDDLRTVHNSQLVYSNRQDIALTLLTGFKIWLVHNCQTEEDHLNIKIVTALLLYNACTLLFFSCPIILLPVPFQLPRHIW